MYQSYVKNILDRLLSFLGIVILFPIILLIAILVKITSKGPVLFKQRRIGLNNVEFYIYKFRTMSIVTPDNIPTHLLENPNKHITKIGKLLRKTSLDELPQLINILTGKMSIIGPRPALWNQFDLIKEREKYCVNKIKPGLTGWAQINGRDELSIQEKVSFDAYYLSKISLRFDVKIFFLTLIRIINSTGVVEGKKTKINND